MDYSDTLYKTPGDELQRLSTFGRRPIPSILCSGITNSASKFAGAYFQRKSAVEDEVWCKYCGVTFSNWKDEYPAAVHRVISPKCPALNTPPADDGDVQCQEFLENLQENPFREYLPITMRRQLGWETPTSDFMVSEGVPSVRRQLFQSSDGDGQDSNSDALTPAAAPPSVLCNGAVVKHPFMPSTGNYNHLFASYRQKTYPGAGNHSSQAWAEEGFVFLGEGHVKCVFCGARAVKNGLHPHSVHLKAKLSCPLIMGTDVGNITCQQELEIMIKYMEQQHSKTVSHNHTSFVVKHPQYEDEGVRKDTFRNWPKMCAAVFPADLMCSAGFFYSGCTDKVVCFSCGVELYNWEPEADVWQHHAKVSPICQFVIDQKGQHFIELAAGIEICTDVKYLANQNGPVTDNGTVIAEAIGTPTLDQTAVKAAFACRYPNKAILLSALKAADENHFTICEQQQAVTQLQTVIQEKDTQLQTVIQEKDTQLQTVIQNKELTVQKMGAQLTQQAAQLNQQAAQLTHQEANLRMQQQQIRCLIQQVQQLRADHQPGNVAVHRPQGDGAWAAANMDSRLLCKICLTEESSMIFLPCGHVTSCVSCASRLPEKRCPVCRQDISEKLPAFVV